MARDQDKDRRDELQQALELALKGVCVAVSAAATTHTVNIYGNQVMNKKIEIHNQGQFAGNVDSPRGKVLVDRQQQVQMSTEQEQALNEHISDPEVQEALALPLPDEEKAQIVGGRLAKVAKVGVDVAVDFATKFIAEMIRPR